MSEWILHLMSVSISADGRYKRRSKNMKNNSKYYLLECDYYMSCKLLNKIGQYKLQSKTNNTSNNPFAKYGGKKVKKSSFINFTTNSNLYQVRWSGLYYLKFSEGGTRLLKPALFRTICWKKCYPSGENMDIGLKFLKRFPVPEAGTVFPGPVRHFNAES